MNDRDKDIVVRSFGRLYARKRQLGARFYLHLFALAPEVRGLFSDNIRPQQDKFDEMIALAVAHLSRTRDLIPALETLAQRHRSYGVRAEHFAFVGDALIAALRDEVPGGLTAEEETAWTEVYRALCDIMLPLFEDDTTRGATQAGRARSA